MPRSRRLLSACAAALFLLVLIGSVRSSAYSVLTHEEIIDLLWTDQIRPLLLQRYPGLSEEQITEAHAYAYGARSSRIWATTRLAAQSLATWFTTFAVGTLFGSCCSKVRMLTSTPSR